MESLSARMGPEVRGAMMNTPQQKDIPIVPSRLQRTVLENHTVGSFMNLTPCCNAR